MSFTTFLTVEIRRKILFFNNYSESSSGLSISILVDISAVNHSFIFTQQVHGYSQLIERHIFHLQKNKESLHCQHAECIYCRSAHDFCLRFEYPKLAEIIKQKMTTNRAVISDFLSYEKQILAKMGEMRNGINEVAQFGWISKKYADILKQIYIKKNPSILRGREANYLCEVLKKSHQITQNNPKIKSIISQFTSATNKVIQDYQKLKVQSILSIINVQARVGTSLSSGTPSTVNPPAVSATINSKILGTNDIPLLRTWLKNPKKIQLIFRGSEFGFQSSKFHQVCGNIPHTLVLVKNEFQKVFGGYTPLKWNSAVNNYVLDPSAETFIFSLNMKEKMNLMPGQYALYCNTSYGPTFGSGNDISISNQCHINNGSFCNFPSSFNQLTTYSNAYINGNSFSAFFDTLSSVGFNNITVYSKSQTTSTAFCGSVSGRNFKVIQYEVFKISWV